MIEFNVYHEIIKNLHYYYLLKIKLHHMLGNLSKASSFFDP